MTQEDKDLLLKDLCARLPYGVKVKLGDNPNIFDLEYRIKFAVMYGDSDKLEDILDITNIKLYLFPLSSMTKEQYKEWCDLEAEPLEEILGRNKMSTLEHHLLIAKSLIDPVNYCYKNHFDIYGLIEKGLALDATGLNIY